MTDRQLVELLISDDNVSRNKGFRHLVDRDYTSVKVYVQRNSGSEDDAKDAFQDGLLALLKNLQKGEFKSSSTLKSYLFSICKNIWLQELRKMKHSQELGDDLIAEDQVKEKIALEERYKLVKEQFSKLGEDCQKILIQFYYDKKSMKDLQTMFDLSSEQAAKNKKSRCLKKLTEMVVQ
jgi:RNA polymerase sigma factor (sigma-70 family)